MGIIELLQDKLHKAIEQKGEDEILLASRELDIEINRFMEIRVKIEDIKANTKL